jgi:hypothetical protein
VDTARRAAQFDSRARARDLLDAATLVEAYAEAQDGIAQSPAEASRIEDGRSVNPDSREVGGRIDLRADGIAVEPLHGFTESPEIHNMLAQALDLVGSRRNPKGAVLFDVRVDSVALQRREQLTVVFEAELLEGFDFCWKVPQAIEEAVREG